MGNGMDRVTHGEIRKIPVIDQIEKHLATGRVHVNLGIDSHIVIGIGIRRYHTANLNFGMVLHAYGLALEVLAIIPSQFESRIMVKGQFGILGIGLNHNGILIQ
jgi:hypothetical protein